MGFAAANIYVTINLKPRPNDRNISTQHIGVTLLHKTCCVRLATLCVATCWVLLVKFIMQHFWMLHNVVVRAFSFPELTILLACGRNRELWEQPFQACAVDTDCIEPDGQNSVISFVISKTLLPELSIPAAGQKDRRLWGRECSSCRQS